MVYRDKRDYHFRKASEYQMLAKFYEHKDPAKHIYYYKKHFYHEQKFVKYSERKRHSYGRYESCE